MTIGDRIKQRRIELGLTADDLANRIGKSRATVYRYENGDIESFPTTVLEPLAEALQTTPANLMGWDKEEKIADFMVDFMNNDYLIELSKTASLLNNKSQKRLLRYIELLIEEQENE